MNYKESYYRECRYSWDHYEASPSIKAPKEEIVQHSNKSAEIIKVDFKNKQRIN